MSDRIFRRVAEHAPKTVIDTLKTRGLVEVGRLVAEMYGVSLWELCGASKELPPTRARQHVWSALYDRGHYSYPVLGRIFRRDHTTIMAGVKAHRARDLDPCRGVQGAKCA